MWGVPQLVVKIQLRQQFVYSRRASLEPTLLRPCVSQPCEGCRGAGTACLLLLSLEIKSEPGPTAGGEVGVLISAPVPAEHKLPGGLAVWLGGRNKKIHVWHHKGISSENS